MKNYIDHINRIRHISKACHHLRVVSIIRFLTKTRRRKILSGILAVLILLTSTRLFFFPAKEVKASDVYIGMDEGYGTSSAVHDTNNQVSAGSITNAVWKAEELCKVGKCLYFDGTGDYVSFGDDSDLDMAASDTVTIELWFRTPDITSGTRTLISKEEATGADGGYRIQMNSSGKIVFGIDNDNSGYPLYSITTEGVYDDNLWHHIAAVKNGTSSMTLYMDGQLPKTISIASTDASNDDNFYVGIYNASSDGFMGFIDEVKILRTARSADNVKADYTSETPLRGTSVSFSPNQSYLSNGLVGYWKLDEYSAGSSPTNRSDSSGNALTLTDNGTTASAGGKFGNGSEHVPANTEYLSTATTIYGIKTVSFWVNPDSTTNYYISLTSGAYITSSGTIAVTGFTNSKVYVNGVSTAVVTQDVWQLVTVTTDTAIDANQFYVGRQGSNYFDGTSDDVRLYNRTLSPNEVERLYSWGPAPTGWWKLDENSGTSSANDSSQNGKTITMNSLTQQSWIPGKIGSALNFNGTSQYLSRADDSDFDYITGQSFTIELWFKHTSIININDPEDFLITKADGTNGGWKVELTDRDTNANICFAIDDDNNWTPDDQVCTSGINYDTLGVWHHFAGVMTGTSKIEVFIDGISIGSDISISAAAGLDNTAQLEIGRDSQTSSNYWQGQLDDVRIYSYARTQAQIVEDMNAGHPAPGSPVGSATSYWKFDEGALNSCSGGTNDFCDSSINTNDLAYSTTSGGYTNSGKLGKAFDGDGTKWASRTNDNDFDVGTGDFSFSFWFKSDNSGGSGTQYIVNRASAAIAGFAIYGNSSGNIVFGVDDDTTWGPDASVATKSNLYDQTWHHITAVKTSTPRLDIYVDGMLNNYTISGIPTGSLSNDLTFYLSDRDGTDNGDEFIGDLDEVKFYTLALTADQVKMEFNQGKAVVMGAKSTTSTGTASWSAQREYCPPGNTEANCGSGDPSPIFNAPLDENSGTNVRDISGNNLTASVGGNTDWKPGFFGSSYYFDGNSDDLTFSHATLFDFGTSTPFTLQGWFKVTDKAADQAFISRQGVDTDKAGFNLLFSDASGKLQANIRTATPTVLNCRIDSSTAINFEDNQWHFIAIVYYRNASCTTNDTLIYVDGRRDTNTTVAVASGNNNQDIAVTGLQISTSSNTINGQADEVRVYNYARTPAQIAWDYNRGKPQGWWKFDENTGTTAYDSSGKGYNSQTYNGNITYVAGKRNYALTFDGTNDNVRITEGLGIDVGETNSSYSVSAWFNTSTDYTINPGAIVAKDDGTGVYPFSLQINTSEQPCIVMNDGSTRTLCGSSTVNNGVWHLITAVRDVSADTITLYIDGVRVNYQTDPTSATMVNDDDISIGNSGAASYMTNDFNGTIDDVQIFNYPLTQQQINNIMNLGVVRYGS